MHMIDPKEECNILYIFYCRFVALKRTNNGVYLNFTMFPLATYICVYLLIH